MTEFRIMFSETKGVNVEANTPEEAKEIVKDRECEYGMEWTEGEPEIISIDVLQG